MEEFNESILVVRAWTIASLERMASMVGREMEMIMEAIESVMGGEKGWTRKGNNKGPWGMNEMGAFF